MTVVEMSIFSFVLGMGESILS